MRAAVEALFLLLFIGATVQGGSGSLDWEECKCPQLETDYTCVCTAPKGYITTSPNVSDAELEYWIDPGYYGVVLFTHTDLALTPSPSSPSSPSSSPSLSLYPCRVSLGERTYYSGEESDVEEDMIVSDTYTPVTILRSHPDCRYTIHYVIYELECNSKNTSHTESSGTITAPPDPNHLFNYQPFSRCLHIINVTSHQGDTEGQGQHKVDFYLDHVDLGGPSYTINNGSNNGSQWNNYTAGDFLLIGAGVNVLSGDEVMYYGREATQAGGQGVTVVGGLAHVLFHADGSIDNATGFTISYNTTQQVTTQAPPTTTPAALDLPHTFVSINGIPVDQWQNATARVKEALANMSTDYLHNYMGRPELPPVTSEDITITDIGTCDPFRCRQGACVAYDFGVAVWEEQEPVFTKEKLNNMLAEPRLQHYIQEIGRDCEICREDEKRAVWLYIAVPVAVVLVALIVSLVFWKYSATDTTKEAQQRYEQEAMEKKADQKRRSSGDISILGLGMGDSFASQGTFSSRRFTMPFPKHDRLQEEEEEDDEEVEDVSGFREYDPDLGHIHPHQLGLSGVPTSNFLSPQGRTNLAFVGDEGQAVKIQRASFQDSDTDDSEGGHAVSFQLPTKTRTNKTSLVVPADVHTIDDDVGETAL